MADDKDSVRQKIDDAEMELASLYSRMDQDKDLYYLKEFEMRDREGRKVPNVDNITLNDAATFGERAVSILGGAVLQTVVEGEKLTDKATALIEDFLEVYYQEVDDGLVKEGVGRLEDFLVHQSLFRGSLVARVLPRFEGEEFDPGILPCDSRYFSYELTRKGLKWGCYNTWRTRAQIEEEYTISLQSKNEVVRDYWDDEKNVVYVGNRKVHEAENEEGAVPFLFEYVPTGSMLMGQDSLQHRGESLYAANRGLYDKQNKVASWIMTQAGYGFKPPMQFRSDSDEMPPHPEYGVGKVIPVGTDEEFLPMPTRDMMNATRHIWSILAQRIQQGGLPAIDYGNLTFPLSAVAITKLTSSKDQIFLPRMQALALFRRRLSTKVIAWMKKNKLEIKLGQPSKTYAWHDLAGEYTVGFKFFAANPEQQMANYTIAASASAVGVSDETIFKDILQYADPHRERMRKQSEDAIKSSAALTKYNYIKALLEENRQVEAKILAEELGLTLDMIRSGQLQPVQPPTPRGGVQPDQNLPLLGGGGGMGPRRGPIENQETEGGI